MATLQDLKPCLDGGQIAIRHRKGLIWSSLKMVDRRENGTYVYEDGYAGPPAEYEQRFTSWDELTHMIDALDAEWKEEERQIQGWDLIPLDGDDTFD